MGMVNLCGCAFRCAFRRNEFDCRMQDKDERSPVKRLVGPMPGASEASPRLRHGLPRKTGGIERRLNTERRGVHRIQPQAARADLQAGKPLRVV